MVSASVFILSMKRTVSLHKGNFRAGGTEITNTKTKSSPDALKNGSDGKFDVTDILPPLKKHNTHSPVLITKLFLFHATRPMWRTQRRHRLWFPYSSDPGQPVVSGHHLLLPGRHYDNLKPCTNRDHFFMKLLIKAIASLVTRRQPGRRNQEKSYPGPRATQNQCGLCKSLKLFRA